MTPFPFPCPDCGGPTTVRANYPRHDDTVRYRRCEPCDYRFRTVQLYGSPERYDGEPDDPPEPVAEIEPLDLAALDPAEERRERLRLLFIWCKGDVRAERRPVALRRANGYGGKGDERRFYEE